MKYFLFFTVYAVTINITYGQHTKFEKKLHKKLDVIEKLYVQADSLIIQTLTEKGSSVGKSEKKLLLTARRQLRSAIKCVMQYRKIPIPKKSQQALLKKLKELTRSLRSSVTGSEDRLTIIRSQAENTWLGAP